MRTGLQHSLPQGFTRFLVYICLKDLERDEPAESSWDAQNMDSVHLAEKLGYEYDHEYTAYEVSGEEGAY